MNDKRKLWLVLLIVLVILIGVLWYVSQQSEHTNDYQDIPLITPDPNESHQPYTQVTLDYSQIPPYDGSPDYIIAAEPFYGEFEKTASYEYEYYSMLDELGRCGKCEASVCTETLPEMDRGEIGSVKPSGWKQAKYDFVDGKYVYNRCHLIGYQLTAENANPLNLITGTRYLNVIGMLPYENAVADYMRKHPDNHVFYRVVPIFVDNELVCRGVWMQAWSVEDNGKLSFNVFCYNVQPGVYIDYLTGETHQA